MLPADEQSPEVAKARRSSVPQGTATDSHPYTRPRVGRASLASAPDGASGGMHMRMPLRRSAQRTALLS
jgi:hypothetical protein